MNYSKFFEYLRKKRKPKTPVYNYKIERQINLILGYLGTFSVVSILGAIDRGKIDGKFYGDEPDDLAELQANNEEFVGCLLGWSGFLEQVHHNHVRARAFGITRYMPEGGDELCFLSKEAEDFIGHIREGDLPATNPYLAILRGLVEAELERRNRLSNRILIEIPPVLRPVVKQTASARE